MTQARVTEKLVDAAIEVLATMLRFEQPADAALSRHFREHKLLGQRERAFIAETAYSVLRHKRSLSRLCGDKPTPRKLLLAALVRLQGLSVRQFGDIASARERTWLEDLRAGPEGEVSLAEQADFPDWLMDKLLPAYAGEADPAAAVLALARGLNQSAPLDLRINPMKTNREDALAALAASGIEGEACRYAPLGIRLKEKPALGKHPLFVEGAIEVQDEGSQLLGHLLAPKRGEMVVDFCAGAGGKTLLLGALMRSTGRLYAFDTSDRRLAKLKPRMARSGLSNVHPAALASEHDSRVKRLAGKIDRVLVDAPCSGLGTLRRNPDLKWRQTEGSIAELTAKQARILEAAAKLVRPGGRVVYATCSLLVEENEAIVDAFLAAHPEFQRVSCKEVLEKQGIAIDTGIDLRLAPHTHGTDGFYAAVLERAPAAKPVAAEAPEVAE